MMCVGQDQKQIGALIVPRLGELARRGVVAREIAGAWGVCSWFPPSGMVLTAWCFFCVPYHFQMR
jgi:hypothetical protein